VSKDLIDSVNAFNDIQKYELLSSIYKNNSRITELAVYDLLYAIDFFEIETYL